MFNYLHVWYLIKIKQLANFVGTKHTNYIKFVILCEGRTGSTLLHTYLNSNRSIYSYGEIGQPIHDDQNGINTLVKPFSKMIKAVGFKLFYKNESSKLFKEAQKDSSIKVIHLYRENSLRLYTSMKIAEATGNWSYGKNEDSNKKRIHVNPIEVKEFIDNYLLKQHQFAAQFSKHDSITMSYEELVENPLAVLNEVQNFLGVPVRKLKSVLKKQNPEPLSELIINYEELLDLK